MTETVYISLPITGKDLKEVRQHIAEVRTMLHEKGCMSLSPLGMSGWEPGQSWEWYMVRCIDMMRHCDAIYLCKGWEESRGCNMEKEYAEFKNLKIYKE